MNVKTAYLDSSAIVKRYIEEVGSSVILEVYRRTYNGVIHLAFSLWNVGEVLGVLERAYRRGLLEKATYLKVRGRFLGEIGRLVRLGLLTLIPIRLSILKNSWKIIEEQHIYQADALQIASALHVKATAFLTGDRKLCKIAETLRLTSINVETTRFEEIGNLA